MLLGQQIGSYSPSAHGNHWDTTLAAALACEQAGLDSVWLADHFMFPDRAQPDKEVPVFDCFVALAAIAARTSRIRIGALVVGVPYRNPALLAKMSTTLDVIAHGRTIVGLGAAWHDEEFVAYGWPFPSVRDRMEMLEEAVQIVDRMMTQRPASFAGKHYRVVDAYNDPPPVQRPHPPIMIGGRSTAVLRVVAEHADLWNIPGGDIDDAVRRSALLDRYCAEIGRDPASVTRSIYLPISYDQPSTTREEIGKAIDAGFQHIVLGLPAPYPANVARWVTDELITTSA